MKMVILLAFLAVAGVSATAIAGGQRSTCTFTLRSSATARGTVSVTYDAGASLAKRLCLIENLAGTANFNATPERYPSVDPNSISCR